MPSLCAKCSSAIGRRSPSKQCGACRKLFHVNCAPYTGSPLICCKTNAPLPARKITEEPIFSDTRRTDSPKRSRSSSSSESPTLKQLRLLSPPAPQRTLEDALSATPTAQSIGPSVAMETGTATAGEAAPSYFSAFLLAYRNDVDSQNKMLQNICTGMADMSQRIENVEATSRRHDEVLNSHSHALTTFDACEICFAGIPCEFAGTSLKAVELILRAINIPGAAAQILVVRDWLPAADAAANTAHRQNTPNNDFRAVVAQFSSPATRDIVLRAVGRLARPSTRSTAQLIFGAGGDRRISITPLYPAETRQLLFRARDVSRSLGYLSPVVSSLIVCLRPARNAKMVEVPSMDFLERYLAATQEKQSINSGVGATPSDATRTQGLSLEPL